VSELVLRYLSKTNLNGVIDQYLNQFLMSNLTQHQPIEL